MLHPLLTDSAALAAYTRLLNLFLAGRLDPATASYFVDSVLIGISKPGTDGVRPIGMGDVSLRRVAARAAVSQVARQLAEYLAPVQLGICVANGVEIVARVIQLYLEAHPSHVCAKLDLANAFNECSRHAMRSEIASAQNGEFSGLLPVFDTLYGTPNRLHVVMGLGDAPALFTAAEGVTQGCPLAGAAFDLAIHPPLRRANARLALVGGLVIAIQDDAYLLGPLHDVAAAFRPLVAELREHCGLRANARKTAILTLEADLSAEPLADLFRCPPDPAAPPAAAGAAAAPPPAPSVFDISTPLAARGFIAVGVPVGHPDYVASATARLAADAAAHLPARIAACLGDHFHVAQLLLRKCAVPSLIFLVRALAPALTHAAALAFDEATVGCMLALLRLDPASVPPGASTRLQIQLPVGGGMGGLGVNPLAAIAPAAHAASVEASLPLLSRICPAAAAAFAAPLPADPAALVSPPPSNAAAAPQLLPSVGRYRRALAALPAAAYYQLLALQQRSGLCRDSRRRSRSRRSRCRRRRRHHSAPSLRALGCPRPPAPPLLSHSGCLP